MQSVNEVLQAVLLVVSIVGACVAVWTYRRDSNRRRAEWLMSLYEKFYEQPQYKRVRFVLDYKPPEYDEYRSAIESGAVDERAEQLVDYLNFFEFIGSLATLGQISTRDIRMLFDYYVRQIGSHEWLRRYVGENGFESLDQLLARLAPDRS